MFCKVLPVFLRTGLLFCLVYSEHIPPVGDKKCPVYAVKKALAGLLRKEEGADDYSRDATPEIPMELNATTKILEITSVDEQLRQASFFTVTVLSW